MEKERLKIKLDTILGTIFMIVCLIVLGIYSYLENDFKKFNVIVALTIIVLLILLCVELSSIKYRKNEKRLEENYNLLKNKDLKSIFEELYIYAYGDNGEEVVRKVLNRKNVKDIKSLCLYNMGFNEINLSFNYKGFDVNFNIENDKAYYNIDTPSRYDGLDENVEYEEKKYDISPCDNFLCLDDYLNYIVDLIETIKVDINQFSNNIIVDEIFNGRLLKKINDFKERLKSGFTNAIVFLILFIICLLPVFLFFDPKHSIETVVLINMFAFFYAIICIYCMVKSFKEGLLKLKIERDYSDKNYNVITGNPTKVKILKESYSKYNNRIVLVAVIISIDNQKLIIPFSNETINNKKNIKKVCEECKNINVELKYLTESKVVIDGEKPYVKIIEKYLLNGKRK